MKQSTWEPTTLIWLQKGDRFKTTYAGGHSVYTVDGVPRVDEKGKRTVPISWRRGDGSHAPGGRDDYSPGNTFPVWREVVVDFPDLPEDPEPPDTDEVVSALILRAKKAEKGEREWKSRYNRLADVLAGGIEEIDLDTTTRVLQKVRDNIRNRNQ